MPKTRAEKYEIYEEVSIKGSTSFSPVKTLAPNTEIDLISEDASFFKQSYHYVEVKDGPHTNTFGYLPAFSLLDCDVLQSKVGLNTVSTTGVKYGGGGSPKGDTVSTGFTAHGHDLNFDLPFNGKEGCPYCGSTLDCHTMEESEEAKRLAQQVHGAIAGLPAPPPGNSTPQASKFMIGVLITAGSKKGSKLLAVSNGFPKASEGALETAAGRLGLNLITRSEVDDWENLRDFTGKPIKSIGDKKVEIKNMKADFLRLCGAPHKRRYVAMSVMLS
ncbi:MAG: hypothetical protein WBE72_19535 [Terracidiphilus sp.]